MLSDIILINSNPNNKHLQNRNNVYINEREVLQNVKITRATSDINHMCIWSLTLTISLGITNAREAMKKLPEEDRAKIEQQVEVFRIEKRAFDNEVCIIMYNISNSIQY